MANNDRDDNPLELLAETDSFAILLGEDFEGERIYNIELGSVTLHLFEEEWTEFVSLIKAAAGQN